MKNSRSASLLLKLSSTAIVIASLVLVASTWAQPTEIELLAFQHASSQPYGGVIFDAKGNLYGTSFGNPGAHRGNHNVKTRGVVFELKQSKKGFWSKQTLYTFTGGNDGANPRAGLIFDGAVNLYGTTVFGGTSGAGVVFELSPVSKKTWSEKVLWSFDGHGGGSSPVAGLVFDNSGNLYGTTEEGGAFGNGTVFELTPGQDGSWSESVLYSFSGGNDGGFPLANLVIDGAGNLYGTTYGDNDGSGTVFELSPGQHGSWTENVLHVFPGYPDGSNPAGGVIFDGLGNLYGTTYDGGTQGLGIVFQLTPGAGGTWDENVLHSFCYPSGTCTDGGNPAASLALDSAGNLYGTTEGSDSGGGCFGGTVFELSPDGSGGWNESILHEFSYAFNEGCEPASSITFDSAGNLYGTTLAGGRWPGDQGFGTSYEIIP